MKICCTLLLVSVLLLSTNLVMAQQPQSDLDAARTLWTNLTGNMPSNYTFEYGETTDGQPPRTQYVIDVRNDVIARVYTLDVPAFDQEPIDTTGFRTVPDLFNVIQESITNGATDLMYQYNPDFGYPESISYTSTTGPVAITVPVVTPYTILEKELNQHVALWNSFGSAKDSYSFVTQVTCFCESSYVTPKFIVVEDNTIVSTVDVATMAPSDNTYDAIPELFARIQQAIDNFDVTIQVSYNETYGFPTSISTNPEYLLMDAGVTIQVSNVTFSNMDTVTSPPTLAPVRPITGRWCFGLLKFNVWCRQG